jgi:energy-converting hydrogenase Eha subunit B
MNGEIQTNLFWSLLLIYIAAYFVCGFIAVAVNFIVDRKIMNSRFLGVFGVLTVGFVVMFFSVSGLDTQDIPPYQRGLLLGDAISRVTTPGVLVLAFVGIFAWLERKKDAANSPNE